MQGLDIQTIGVYTTQVEHLRSQLLVYFLFLVQISYECSLKARDTFLTFYSSLLDTLITDAPTIGSSDAKYKKVGDFL